MKNFKPGQKVVFTGKIPPGCVRNENSVWPLINEIVTIKRQKNSKKGRCAWEIIEYPFLKDGEPQVIDDNQLEPIKSITIQLHEVKLEPRKVIQSQPIHAQ